MPTADYRSVMPVSADALYAWHARPGAFARLAPPWERIELLDATPGWAEGTRWRFRGRWLGPLNREWTVEHHDVVENRQFCYRQLHGPFRRWDHCLSFKPDGDASVLDNHIDYQAPFGAVSNAVLHRRIERLFTWRHAITVEDLKRHHDYRDRPRLNIAITGSRGLIGRDVVNFMLSGGHRIHRLVSGTFCKPPYDDGSVWQEWKPNEPLPPRALQGVDAVINLAGNNLASGRWTADKKTLIRNSRIIPTRHLAAAVERDGVPIFLSGSAIGCYGDRGDEILNESSPLGDGFLADVCRDWEAASQCNARVVNLRTGVVLSMNGGALAKQLPVFKMGQGAVLGSGRQMLSWIDLQDMVYAINHLLMNPISGPVNLCSPQPASNRVFGRVLAKVLHRPYLLTVPPFALRLFFGEMADAALLASQNVRPAKLLDNSFCFSHDDLERSLRTELGL